MVVCCTILDLTGNLPNLSPFVTFSNSHTNSFITFRRVISILYKAIYKLFNNKLIYVVGTSSTIAIWIQGLQNVTRRFQDSMRPHFRPRAKLQFLDRWHSGEVGGRIFHYVRTEILAEDRFALGPADAFCNILISSCVIQRFILGDRVCSLAWFNSSRYQAR